MKNCYHHSLRWGPFPSTSFAGLPDSAVATETPENGVDDIYIAVIIGEIDGVGKRYAEASQSRISASGGIIAAKITVDTIDVSTALEQEIFEDLMAHEIGHALGVGTLWGDNTEGGRYVGTNALQAWRDIGCEGDLPLQSATDTAHWSESCLGDEIMTPLLRFRQANPLSNITMGALEDLGYTVDRSLAEPFGLSDLGNCGSFCPAAGRRILLGTRHPNLRTRRNK